MDGFLYDEFYEFYIPGPTRLCCVASSSRPRPSHPSRSITHISDPRKGRRLAREGSEGSEGGFRRRGGRRRAGLRPSRLRRRRRDVGSVHAVRVLSVMTRRMLSSRRELSLRAETTLKARPVWQRGNTNTCDYSVLPGTRAFIHPYIYSYIHTSIHTHIHLHSVIAATRPPMRCQGNQPLPLRDLSGHAREARQVRRQHRLRGSIRTRRSTRVGAFRTSGRLAP